MMPPPVTTISTDTVPSEEDFVAELFSEARSVYKQRFISGEGMTAHVIETKCIGCDQCLSACKFDALELVSSEEPMRSEDLSTRKARIIEPACNKEVACSACAEMCPVQAIEMRPKGWRQMRIFGHGREEEGENGGDVESEGAKCPFPHG